MLKYRESALTATSLLVPLVGLILLWAADMDAATQAGWNAVAVAAAGLISAALVVQDKLVPAILGFAQAVLQLLAVYGLGFTAEQTTGLLGFLALVLGAYVRTQVRANVDATGQVVHAQPVG